MISARRGWMVALAFVVAAPVARADGLHVGVAVSAMHFPAATDGPASNGVDFYSTGLSARVSRGRAGLTFQVPLDAISGGRVGLVPGEVTSVVAGAPTSTAVGFGDMSTSLDYNLVQNREKMIIVTLSGSVTFPTGKPGLSSGDYYLGAGLSGVYGITRQLIAYGEVDQLFTGIKSPWTARTRYGEIGAVYWLTKGLGLSAGLKGFDFGKEFGGEAVELTGGLVYELLPGTMLNLGGLTGLAGSGAPTAGGSFGFGFEL